MEERAAVAALLRAAKEAKKAGKMVLRAIKMDGATAADKERCECEIKERALTKLYNPMCLQH